MTPFWADEIPRFESPGKSVLPYGLGRSYGDSCVNDGGILLKCGKLDRFISFDGERGVLRCEGGVSLAAILERVVPAGWFLPVTPGTKFVTLAGAIANDVHGKNHHRAGTFGRFVRRLALLRSDGTRIECGPDENREWFEATVGGLGLTGFILWAEIQLTPIRSAMIDVETIRFSGLKEYFDLSRESEQGFDYTVSWIDCMASGSSLGRGHFIRGNFSEAGSLEPASGPARRVPFDFPSFALNGWSIKGFNFAYYQRQQRRLRRSSSQYEPFFYPLDSIRDWNRIYGKRGFFQYQCVVPEAGQEKGPIAEILHRISRARTGSFLAVLKNFGDLRSPGMLSFPRAGVTLALDFPNQGQATRELFESLDEVVRSSGGALYPAKDARMSAMDFQSAFPRWREFSKFVDPRFSSSFWRRVTR